MELNGMGASGSNAYQAPLGRTGNPKQALVSGIGGLLGGAGAFDPAASFDAMGSFDPIAAFDPIASLSTGSNSQALVSLGYGGVADSGSEGGNVQAMLATLGGGAAMTFPQGAPATATGLFPASTQALPRTPYGPSQNPDSAAAQQGVASIQQFLATSGLNLLA